MDNSDGRNAQPCRPMSTTVRTADETVHRPVCQPLGLGPIPMRTCSLTDISGGADERSGGRRQRRRDRGCRRYQVKIENTPFDDSAVGVHGTIILTRPTQKGTRFRVSHESFVSKCVSFLTNASGIQVSCVSKIVRLNGYLVGRRGGERAC
jgi:hypothetical protein